MKEVGIYMKHRILGLDDDNHSPSFVDENGTVFNTFKELVDFLSQPHRYEIEVKMFALVDEWSDELKKYNNEEVNSMFDVLIGIMKCPENMNIQNLFDLFWESANREWW